MDGRVPEARSARFERQQVAVLVVDDEAGMRAALREARSSLARDEVPVGCVIVHDGMIVGRGHNQVESLQDATAHAEVLAKMCLRWTDAFPKRAAADSIAAGK